MYYFDTSALVKRYFKESGSKRVLEIFEENLDIFTSSITYAEVYATLARLKNEGIISNKQYQEIVFLFEADWSKFAVVEFNHQVRSRVPAVINQVRLRGADLVHLVSAKFLTDSNLAITCICTDKKLLNALSNIDIRCEEPA